MIVYGSAILLFVSLLFQVAPASAQGSARLLLNEESRLWIEGSSSVNTFACEARQLSGEGTHLSPPPSTDGTPVVHPARAAVSVPVRAFECGRKRMNQDLYATLRASVYPEIRYEVDSVTVAAAPDSATGLYRLWVVGRLTIGDTERRLETAFEGEPLPDGRLRARGSQPLMMTDFGIEPPSALFGLIQARDHIVIRFDLVASGAS